ACDQVVDYQIVLADGRIVEANNDEHADLFLTLKGGSANFGIVNRFDFETLDETRLWGGMRVMSKSSTPEQIESLVQFTANIPNDIYSFYVVLWNYQPSLGDIAVTAMLANTKAEEKPAAMKKLLAIPAIMDTTKQTTLAQVAAESEQPYAGMHVSEAELNDYGDAQAKEWLAGVEEFAREKGTFVD
ncbi:6-Hydroxy-D-Nicotine Oxidase, partial [Fusarium albosuccineum]